MLKAAGSGVGKGDGLPSPPAKQLSTAAGGSYRERLREILAEDYRIRGCQVPASWGPIRPNQTGANRPNSGYQSPVDNLRRPQMGYRSPEHPLVNVPSLG